MVSNNLLTVSELAQRLRISASAALRMVQVGRVRSINVSAGKKRARYRIPESALRELTGEPIPDPPKQAPKNFYRIV